MITISCVTISCPHYHHDYHHHHPGYLSLCSDTVTNNPGGRKEKKTKITNIIPRELRSYILSESLTRVLPLVSGTAFSRPLQHMTDLVVLEIIYGIVYMYVCLYHNIYMYICMYVCKFMIYYIYTYMYAYIYILYICMYVYMYVCIYVCMYVCVYTYVCMYVSNHTG
jgi:hypothetical protein